MVCVWGRGHTHAIMHMWRPEDSFQEPASSICHVVMKTRTQVFGLEVSPFTCWTVLLAGGWVILIEPESIFLIEKFNPFAYYLLT